jgi:hypothetical protein
LLFVGDSFLRRYYSFRWLLLISTSTSFRLGQTTENPPPPLSPSPFHNQQSNLQNYPKNIDQSTIGGPDQGEFIWAIFCSTSVIQQADLTNLNHQQDPAIVASRLRRGADYFH